MALSRPKTDASVRRSRFAITAGFFPAALSDKSSLSSSGVQGLLALRTMLARKDVVNLRILEIIHKMSNGDALIVHFACPCCGTVYTAKQERKRRRCAGEFSCDICGSPVLEWTGTYSFAGWKRSEGSGQRRQA